MVKKLITILLVSLAANLMLVNFCYAALPSLVPEECRGKARVSPAEDCPADATTPCAVGCKDCPASQENRAGCCCNLSSIERMAFNIASIILGVAGSLALLVFVISGGKYILGGFNPSMVGEGKSGMIKALTGLVIILVSGIILKVIINVLTSP